MKLLNKLSLRMRMTLLTGLIVFTASLVLTLTSMYNAHNQFMSISLLQETFDIAAIELTPSIRVDSVPTTDAKASPEPLPATDTSSSPELPPVSFAASTEAALSEDGSTNEMAFTIKSLPAPILTAKKQFDVWSYFYLLIISVVGMVAAYIVSGRALRPVRELNTAVLSITGHNLQNRIPDSGASDEIASLSRSFNTMLDRLEQSFLRQKHFSANVAHELKTPLATMNAGIQVLALDETPSMADCIETLDIAGHNVKRLMSIVDDLLLLTNECAGEYADSITLENLITDIINELTPLYAEKELKIICNIQINEITGNRTLVHRAFFNLVENAMKYSRENGTISISAREGAVSISDNGVGIPAEDIDKIFEPFYRVDPSRSRKVGGAGLGLSIVKTIAEKHGWCVTAQSMPDTGTVMTVTIP